MRPRRPIRRKPAQRAWTNPPTSFRTADSKPMFPGQNFDLSAAMRETLATLQDPVEIVAALATKQLEPYGLEVLTPAELLDRSDDEDYQLGIEILSYKVGQSGEFLIDADFIVREHDKGYPVGIVWSTNALADEAERIAYWSDKIDLSNRMDMTVCVLTLNAAGDYPPAENERREAMVLAAVDKAYWIGDGHPRDTRLTRYADFSYDVCTSRAFSLQL